MKSAWSSCNRQQTTPDVPCWLAPFVRRVNGCSQSMSGRRYPSRQSAASRLHQQRPNSGPCPWRLRNPVWREAPSSAPRPSPRRADSWQRPQP
eukprot:2609344-Prymnesium_polylepis.2